MLSTTLTEFRKNTKKYLDHVTDDADILIINRGKDKAVVLLSLDEYNSIDATMHELSSKANKKRLDESISEYKKGDFFHKDLIEE